MSRTNLTKIRAILVVALVLVSGIGGYTIWRYMQPKAFSTVSGLVHLDEPIVGATVSIYDLEGVKVFEKEDATHTTGSFVIKVGWGIGQWSAHIPDEFTIAASGGKIDNEPFTGTIVRKVQNYSEEGYYHLNAITTLIKEYLDKHPEMTCVEAQEAVKDFLGVPDFIEMDLVVDSAVYYQGIFDHEYFMLQAEEHADFDTFIDVLSEEIDQGDRRLFVAAGGIVGSIIGMIGEGIFSSVIGKGTDIAMGYIMRAIGFKDTEAKLDEMSEKLDKLMDSVMQIEKEIEDIKNELNEIKQAIEDLKKLEMDIELLKLYGIIDSTFTRLQQYSRQETVDNSDLEKLRDNILDPTQGVYYAMGIIHAFVKGNEPSYANTGILEELTKNILDNIPSYETRPDAIYSFSRWIEQNDRKGWDNYLQTLYDNFQNYYQSLENYYTRYLLIQIRGLNLIVEAYHYHNQTDLAKDYIENIFLPNMKEQAEIFMKCVDKLVFNAHPTPMAEFPNMGPIPEVPELSGSLQQYLDNVSYASPYLAQIYPRADYIVDKCLKSFSGGEQGVFKARVLLSMLKPSIDREWDEYGRWTTNIWDTGREPILEFSPDKIWANNEKDVLVFQLCGTNESSEPSGDKKGSHFNTGDPALWPQYEPVKSELREVTIRADAPSRWALPKAVIDFGMIDYEEIDSLDLFIRKLHRKGLSGGEILALLRTQYGIDFQNPLMALKSAEYCKIFSDIHLCKPEDVRISEPIGHDKGIEGKMDHTVPYDKEGTVHYIVFDFGKLPSGYYRIDTFQNAKHVNEGTGWVMDYERKHQVYAKVRGDEKGMPKYYAVSWAEGNLFGIQTGHIQPCPEVVIYMGFKEGPISSAQSTVINPWYYHLSDGLELSMFGFIRVSNDSDGDPYGYWGGYWRQESS